MSDNDLWPNVLGSATAGIISRFFTHPLDTAKARMQASLPSHIKPYKGSSDVIVRTLKGEGIYGLYRGFGAILVGGTPGTVIYLCSYDLIKKNMSSFLHSSNQSQNEFESKSASSNQFLVHFTSGMLAEAITCIVYVPVDVIKERLQVQIQPENSTCKQFRNITKMNSSPQPYKGSFDALQKILKYEGLRGIYKGYLATLGSFGPFSAFYFLFYEETKNWAIKISSARKDKKNDDLPLLHLIACSATSGAAASWITSPLDMAKLRLQVQRGALASENKIISGRKVSSGNPIYHGMIDCLRQVYSSEGIKGIFRGSMARVIHFAPATTITMTCYEKCRLLFQRNNFSSR